jgi:short-subunit dehydrogenase
VDDTSERRSPRGPVRRALVTGASSGIGRAFAARLARDQMDLCLVARRRERLESLAAELRERSGVRVEVHPADLTDREQVGELARALADRTPDLLVNNAGFGTAGPFAELDPLTEEREIELNVLALTRLTHAVLPGMIERGSGAVINVSSLAGVAPMPYTATYGATKAFVTSLTEALAEELRGSGVRVQVLLPGFTRTEFQQVAGVEPGAIPAGAWMTPEAVVEASLAALERGDVTCVPGAQNKLLAAVQAATPRRLTRRIVGAAMRRSLDRREPH